MHTRLHHCFRSGLQPRNVSIPEFIPFSRDAPDSRCHSCMRQKKIASEGAKDKMGAGKAIIDKQY
jgi:hypothetical protein